MMAAEMLTASDRQRVIRALGWRFLRPFNASTANWLYRRAVHACRACERGRLAIAIARRAVDEFTDHVAATGAPVAVVRRLRKGLDR